MREDLIKGALLLAYEAGKWAGQVELEEHYDNEQYASAAFESVYARSQSMPLHEESQGRQVKITLRSQQWRDGVIKSSKEYLYKAENMLVNHQN